MAIGGTSIIGTKSNLSSAKFQQSVSDVLALSGETNVFGTLELASGATLSIKSNCGVGKVLTSDALGVVTWQNPTGNITGVTNGLSINLAKQVGLGGTLNTGNTAIGLPDNTFFSIGAGNPANYFGGRIDLNRCDSIPNQNSLTLGAKNGSRSAITIIPTGITICGSDSGFNGMQYGADYSGNYTCLSIPNAGWVTGQTSGGGGIGWSNLANGSTVAGCGTIASGATICQNTFYGVEAGKCIINGSGYNNTAIGWQALYSITDGVNNVAIGNQTLSSIICGTSNVGIGNGALLSITCGSNNIALGDSVLINNSIGSNNIALGSCALIINRCDNNIAIGSQVLYYNLWGNNNVAIGFNAGYFETGSSKLYIANSQLCSLIYGEFDNEKLCIRGKTYISGLTNATKPNVIYYDSGTHELTYGTTPSGGTSGGTGGGIGWSNLANGSTVAGCGTIASGGTLLCNTFYGVNVGLFTIGADNVGIGYKSLSANTYGFGNVAIGSIALSRNTEGGNNIAIGCAALQLNICGNNNLAIGYTNLQYNVDGCNNIALGNAVLVNNTSGSGNIGNGHQALINNTTGNNNIALGNEALYYNLQGTSNTAMGYQALYNNTGGTLNIGIGVCALFCNNAGDCNIGIGLGALGSQKWGRNNIAIGLSAMGNAAGPTANCSSRENVAIGCQALFSTTCGCWNVAIGGQALYGDTTGNLNTAIGTFALQANTSGLNNTAIGSGALYSNTTGSGNVAIGLNAGYGAIDSNKLYIANSNACTLIYGDFNYKYLELISALHVIATGSTCLNKLRFVEGNQGAGKIMTSDVNGFATWQDGSIALISDITGTTYTIQSDDSGKFLEFTNTGNTTIICPTGLTIGFGVVLVNIGGGNKTITAGSGATIYTLDNTVIIAGAYNAATIYYRAVGKWVGFGNLS